MRYSLIRLALAGCLASVSISGAVLAADTEETTAPGASSGLDAARALVDQGNYGEALPALQQLDRDTPNNADILNLIGFSLRKTGQTDDALAYYNRALSLDPNHRGANEYLGELYLELKQPAKAKERLAVLQQVCGDCEEFKDLQAQVERYAAQ